jgi:hypothetical protein
VSFADDVNKLLAEAKERLEQRAVIPDPGQPSSDPWPGGLLTGGYGIVKHGAVIPMSIELAMDYGLITEEEARVRGWEPTVYPPTPWRRRLRYRLWRWRDAAALKLYRLVAGHDPEVVDD